jgi:hypothetical protein
MAAGANPPMRVYCSAVVRNEADLIEAFVDAVELVDDPFLAQFIVRHAHIGIDDPLALVLACAESLIAR